MGRSTRRSKARSAARVRLKGKSKKKSAKDRFIPIPAKLVWKIRDRMSEKNAQPHDLVFPNGEAECFHINLKNLRGKSKIKVSDVLFAIVEHHKHDSLLPSSKE